MSLSLKIRSTTFAYKSSFLSRWYEQKKRTITDPEGHTWYHEHWSHQRSGLWQEPILLWWTADLVWTKKIPTSWIRFYVSNKTLRKSSNCGKHEDLKVVSHGISYGWRNIRWMLWSNVIWLFKSSICQISRTNEISIKEQQEFQPTKTWLQKRMTKHGNVERP